MFRRREREWAMARSAVLALFFAAIVPGLGLAQEPAGGRYAFVRVAEGALRLDIETGEVSLCVGGHRVPSCTRLSENIRLTLGERAKLEARIAELEAKIAATEQRVGTTEQYASQTDARVAAIEIRQREAEEFAADAAMQRVRVLAGEMMRHLAGAVRDVKQNRSSDEF
jgi:hypothetical protein